MADWEQIRTLDTQGQSEKVLEALKGSPPQGARDWYNWGTASLKQNQLGPARAYLEKALFENQSRPELPTPWIEKNLAIATARLQDKIGTAATREVRVWNEVLAEEPWFLPLEATVGLLALVAGGLLVRQRRLSFWLAAPILFVLFAIPATIAQWTAPAFALQDSVIRSGPGAQFLEIGRTEAGAPLRFTGERREDNNGTWLQVRFENLALGWLPEPSVLRLR